MAETFDPDAYLSSKEATFNPDEYLGSPAATTTEQPKQEGIVDGLGRQLGLTARAAIKGGSFIPNAVADFASGAVNLGNILTGSESRVPYLSQVQEQALNKTFGAPQNKLEEYVQTGAESLVGVPTTAIGKTAARAISEMGAITSGAMASKAAAEKTQEYTDNPLIATAVALATGTAVGASAGAAGAKLTQGRQPTVTLDDVKKKAANGYRAVEDSGMVVKKEAVQKGILDKLDVFAQEERLNPDIVTDHKPVYEQIQNAKSLLSKPLVSFLDIEAIRKNFSTVASDKNPNISRLGKKAVLEIDNFLSNVKPNDALNLSGGSFKDTIKTLEESRTSWRNLGRAQVLQDILETAQIKASGLNAPEGAKIQQGLVSLVASPDKMRMFSTREQNILKAAAESTGTEKMLNMLSKFNPERAPLTAALLTYGVTNLDKTYGMSVAGLAAAGWSADRILAAKRAGELKDIIQQTATGKLKPPKQSFIGSGLFGATYGAKQ